MRKVAIVSVALWLFFLGLIMVVLSVGGSFAAPYLFSLPEETSSEAFWCILLVGLSSAAQCVLSPFFRLYSLQSSV